MFLCVNTQFLTPEKSDMQDCIENSIQEKICTYTFK